MKWHQDYTVKETQKQKQKKTQKQKQKHKNRNKNTKTETKTTTTKKKGKTKRVSHLRDVGDMFFGLTMWNYFFLLRGKLKVEHLSLFMMGGGRNNEGGITWFWGEQGEGETVIANRVQRGGGYKTLTANEGIIKILQRFGGGGGTRLISVWYDKNPPTPP